jgi:hypothetical protein
MPNWLLPSIGFLAIVAFVFFAFRQGMKVKPSDRGGDDHDGPSIGGY